MHVLGGYVLTCLGRKLFDGKVSLLQLEVMFQRMERNLKCSRESTREGGYSNRWLFEILAYSK